MQLVLMLAKEQLLQSFPHGEVVRKPFKVQHTKSDINDLIQTVRSLDGDTKVVMEHTGHYNEILAHAFHEAGIFVCVVNPKLIKDMGWRNSPYN